MSVLELPPPVIAGPDVPGVDDLTIGQRLARRRIACGLDPRELSNATRETTRRILAMRIYGLELGTAYPSKAEIAALAEVLQCSEVYLTHGIPAARLAAVQMDLGAALDARVHGDHEHACRMYEQVLTGSDVIRYLPGLYHDAVSDYAEALTQFGDQRAVNGLRALAERTVLGERSWGTVQAQLVAYHRDCGELPAAIETGRAALFAHSSRRALWGSAGISIAIELLPAHVQAGQHDAAERLINSLSERVGSAREPALQFMTHVAIARAAARMDRAAPGMAQAAASDSERLIHHANQAYEFAMTFVAGLHHPVQLCRMANGHAQLLLTSQRPGPARMALRVLAADRLPWNTQQPATTAYRELYMAKAQRILGDPQPTATRLTAQVLDHERSWAPDLTGRALHERGRAYAMLGRRDDAAQDLHAAAAYLNRAGLHEEAHAATAVWRELSGPVPAANSGAAARPSVAPHSAEALQRAATEPHISGGGARGAKGAGAAAQRCPRETKAPPSSAARGE